MKAESGKQKAEITRIKAEGNLKAEEGDALIAERRVAEDGSRSSGDFWCCVL